MSRNRYGNRIIRCSDQQKSGLEHLPTHCESVLQETAHIAQREIVLVDSASSDTTVDLASRYPIRILRLKADQPLSPAAGRYVGYTQTSGTWVLFLDGDQELYPGWLAQGMAAMHKHADLAAVTGPCIQLPRGSVLRLSLPPYHRAQQPLMDSPHVIG